MAYQPTNPHPYMETIDATVANQFSLQINERSVVTGATIHIHKEPNTADSLLMTVTVSTSYNSNGYFTVLDKDKSIYSTINSCWDEGLSVLIIGNDRVVSKITKVAKSDNYTRIYTTARTSSSGQYNIYTTLPLNIILPDSNFPICGGGSDDLILSHLFVPSTESEMAFFQNGCDYSWDATLSLDEIIYISSGIVSTITQDYDFVCIPYSFAVLEKITDNNENLYIDLQNDEYLVTLKINTEKEIEPTSDGSIRIPVILPSSGLSAEDKIALGETPFYKLYRGDVTLTTPNHYFKARSNPTLRLYEIPQTITTGAWTFKGEYFQNEAVQLAYYQFDLYQNGELIDSSGQQNSRLIQYTFESFMNQSKYEIVLTVVNDENVEAVARQSFYVDYTLLNSTIAPVIESDNANTCIKVDYSNHAEIPGKVSKEGAVSFTDGGIHLIQNETALWDERSDKPLDIPSSSTQVIRWHGDHGFRGRIIEVYDSMYPWSYILVDFDGQKFSARLRGETINELPLYTGVASAISGTDTYSAFCGAATYTASDSTITIMEDITDIIAPGNWVQIENYHCKIKSVDEGIITLDRPLPQSLLANLSTGDNGVHYTFNFSVYNENYIYEINDKNELTDTDILIDNDQVNKYWWLIIINPEGSENRVEIRKSALYTESEV